MRKAAQLEVLLALLGTGPRDAIDGDTVGRRLEVAGQTVKPSALLAQLLTFESSGHVRVDRSDGYRFALTQLGEDTAYELGPGDALECVLVMVDLVGYVAFTAAHGDGAAHGAARHLHDIGDVELRRVNGKVVKLLGDGFLGTARTPTGAVGAVRAIASRCVRPDGERWRVRASIHSGRPIAFRGDLFGADVNLAARLCEMAEPGEVVMTVDDPSAEYVDVRGLEHPIAVTRVALP